MYINQRPTDQQLKDMMRRNNPENKPVGHFTGRCMNCGSTELWDDNTTYGCKCCRAIFVC